MTTLAPFVVHVAAPPVGWTQACAACGVVLLDNAAWSEGRMAVPVGQEHDGPSWWPVGARIATDKADQQAASITYVADDGPLADDERLCAGAN